MTESSRKDGYAAFKCFDGPIISVTEEVFNSLEKQTSCCIDQKNRERLIRVLENFVLCRGLSENSSTYKEQIKVLENLQNNIEGVWLFLEQSDHEMRRGERFDAFTDVEEHAARRAQHRIEDELTFSNIRDSIEQNDENSKRINDYILKQPIHTLVPECIDYMEEYKNHFHDRLDQYKEVTAYFRIAITKALENLREEVSGDRGGQEKDVDLDKLILTLKDIHKVVSTKSGGMPSFIYQCFQLLPEEARPDYPEPHYDLDRKLKSRIDSAVRRKKLKTA